MYCPLKRKRARFAVAALLCCLSSAGGLAVASEKAGTSEQPEVAPVITLVDQYGDTHEYTFPRERVLLITIAGRKGSRNMDPWVETLRERYDGVIDFQGIADLEGVPYLARKFARAMIKKRSKRPVLCDWEGEVSEDYDTDRKAANVIVVSPEGNIVHRQTGPMTDERRDKMFEVIDSYTAPVQATE